MPIYAKLVQVDRTSECFEDAERHPMTSKVMYDFASYGPIGKKLKLQLSILQRFDLSVASASSSASSSYAEEIMATERLRAS